MSDIHDLLLIRIPASAWPVHQRNWFSSTNTLAVLCGAGSSACLVLTVRWVPLQRSVKMKRDSTSESAHCLLCRRLSPWSFLTLPRKTDTDWVCLWRTPGPSLLFLSVPPTLSGLFTFLLPQILVSSSFLNSTHNFWKTEGHGAVYFESQLSVDPLSKPPLQYALLPHRRPMKTKPFGWK